MKSTVQKTWLNRGLALGAGLAMVAGLSLVSAGAANASAGDTIWESDVYTSDIASAGGWEATGTYSVDGTGVVLTGPAQVLYHLTADEQMTQAEFPMLVWNNKISWNSSTVNGVTFRAVLSINGGSAVTLSAVNSVVGSNTPADSGADSWVSDTNIGSTIVANTPATFSDIMDALDLETNVKYLALGVGVKTGTSASTGVSFGFMVNSYLNGVSFNFLPGVRIPEGTVAITGTPTVGSVLTATTAGAWPTGTTFTYQWAFSGGQYGGDIEGATGATYTVTPDHVGHAIMVVVSASKTGYISGTGASTPTDAVVAAPVKAAAPAPVTDSTGLAAYLASHSVTTAAQTSTGLPAGELNPTKPYTANLTWAGADSFVDVYMYSSPTFVGTFPIVNGAAQIALSPTVLAQLGAGNHTLVATGQTSGVIQSVSVSVGASLAATGFDAALPFGGAMLLLLLGVTLVVVRRHGAAKLVR